MSLGESSGERGVIEFTGPVACASVVQKCVTLSTWEAETVVGSVAVSEAIHLNHIRGVMLPQLELSLPTIMLGLFRAPTTPT